MFRNWICIFPPHNFPGNSHRDAIVKLNKNSNLNTIIARFAFKSTLHMNLIFFILNLLTGSSTQDTKITLLNSFAKYWRCSRMVVELKRNLNLQMWWLNLFPEILFNPLNYINNVGKKFFENVLLSVWLY